MEGSLFRHLATPLELRLVVDHLDEDDALAFASTCRAFRAATCLAGSAIARFGERGINTGVASVWSSTARLRWAVGLGYEMDSEYFARAAGMGRLEVLQWARANGCEWNWDTCSAAAEGGHLEVLQWARANGCEWSWVTCSAAAEGRLFPFGGPRPVYHGFEYGLHRLCLIIIPESEFEAVREYAFNESSRGHAMRAHKP
jgi:hypothetical protein